jgi:hypothetical protein
LSVILGKDVRTASGEAGLENQIKITDDMLSDYWPDNRDKGKNMGYFTNSLRSQRLIKIMKFENYTNRGYIV